VSANTYELDTLLRGLRDTPTTGHATDERFIRLTDADITPMKASVGQLQYLKGVATSADVTDVLAVQFTSTGANLKPLPAVRLAATRDGGNDIIMTWLRKDRSFDAKLFGGGNVTPMIETTEEYEIDIYTDADVFLRTKTGVTSETVTYTSAEQSTDGQTPGDQVKIEIYQMSTIVGRGFASDRVEV